MGAPSPYRALAGACSVGAGEGIPVLAKRCYCSQLEGGANCETQKKKNSIAQEKKKVHSSLQQIGIYIA